MTPGERMSDPSPDAIEEIAKATLQRLPSPFVDSIADVVLIIEQFADPDTLTSLGLRDAIQLSGLYQGVSLNRRSVNESGTLPERITLYVQPIIAEWRSTPFSLEQIVSHIVIHEVGHHFGFSDEDMHALENAAE